MGYRFLAIAGVLAVMVALPAPGQTQRGSPKSKTSGIPRTLEGHPDFQGIWTNATITPMQRPPEMAGKATVTDAEARDIEKKQAKELQSLDGRSDDPLLEAGGANGTGFYNVLFMDGGSELARVDGMKRTSLIIDPPDGRMPPITAEAKKQNAEMARTIFTANKVQDRPLAEDLLQIGKARRIIAEYRSDPTQRYQAGAG